MLIDRKAEKYLLFVQLSIADNLEGLLLQVTQSGLWVDIPEQTLRPDVLAFILPLPVIFVERCLKKTKCFKIENSIVRHMEMSGEYFI